MSRLRLRASESFSVAAITLLGVIAVGACGADPESKDSKGIGPIITGSGGSTGGTKAVGSGGSPAGAVTSTGGAVSTGGVTSTGGVVGTGGATGGSPALTGGTSSGGTSSPGAGGTTATGGSPVGGPGGGGSSATGGASSGAPSTGGSGGGAGGMTAGGKAAPDPSAGCGKANPQLGSAGSPLNVSNHQYYVKVPASYDGMKPFPLIFMFNPTGNPIDWAEKNAGFEKNGAKDGAIRVYPHPLNMQSGWGAGDVSFFKPLYDKVTADLCVDKARMFAAGESSGGDFSSILGCEHADLLRSVGPCATKNVGQYPLDVSRRKCTGQVTAVVIHSLLDKVVMATNGPPTRDFYRSLNHCGEVTTPVMNYTHKEANCVEYQGCDDGFPVFWCQHEDPNYEGTFHGWPAFAANFLWELWSKY